jgi:predicted ester cyclase
LPRAENLESVRGFFERVLNGGDLAGLEGLFHRDVLVPQSTPGIDSLRRLLSETRSTFAGPEYKVMDTISDGEKVVVRFSAKAKHAGSYMGLAPTGRPLRLWGVMIFRFEAGAVAEFWSLFDSHAILGQLREP